MAKEKRMTLSSRFIINPNGVVVALPIALTPDDIKSQLDTAEYDAVSIAADLMLVFPTGGQSMTMPRNELASDTYGFPLYGTVLVCPANEYAKNMSCTAQTT